MLNLIKGELYKVFNRPVYIVTALLLWVGIVGMGIFFKYFGSFNLNGEYMTNPLVDISLGFIFITIWILPMFTDVYIEEYKENTLKNLVSSSTPRWKIYIGKYITQILIFLMIFISAIVVMGLTSILLGLLDKNGYEAIWTLILKFLVAMPIYFGVLALYNVITIIFKKETIVIVVIFAVISIVGVIGNFIAFVNGGLFEVLNNYNIFNGAIQSLVYSDLNLPIVFRSIICGLGNMLIYLPLGLFIYKKQEVN